MITRGIHETQSVPAFQHNAKFVACGAANLGTCTCAGGVTGAGFSQWFPGFTIDRLGLSRNFTSIVIAPNAYAEVLVSDENARIQSYGVGVGLQHTSATGGTFADYSTDDWIFSQSLWRQTTATSTASALYSAVQRDAADVLGGVMATATSTSGGLTPTVGSTSTGYAYYTGPAARFDLTGAKRYIRAIIRPIIDSTACASGGMNLSAIAVFGGADEAVPPATPTKRVLVTTGCAT